MGSEKARSYTKGFTWGKREHQLESWTNMALFVTLIVFSVAFYLRSWYLMHFVLAWLLISISVHLIARLCHRFEKKWHNKAHKKQIGWGLEANEMKITFHFIASEIECFAPYLKLIILSLMKPRILDKSDSCTVNHDYVFFYNYNQDWYKYSFHPFPILPYFLPIFLFRSYIFPLYFNPPLS